MEFIDREFGIEKSSQVILRKEDGRQLEANSNLEEFFDKVTNTSSLHSLRRPLVLIGIEHICLQQKVLS